MTDRFGPALVVAARLVSLGLAFALARPLSAQDLFPTPEGRLGGRMPLPTAETLPGGSLPDETPAPSGHPLSGAWLLTFAGEDRAPAQAVFGDDGLVTFSDAGGSRGSGVWLANDQQRGILAIVVRDVEASARPPAMTILRGPIAVESAGDAAALTFTYSVETVDDSGAASEPAGPFTATGQRADDQLIVPTPG